MAIGNGSTPPPSIEQRVARLELVVGDRGKGLVRDSLEALGADRELRVEQLTDRERLDGVAEQVSGVAEDVGALRFTVAIVLASQVTMAIALGVLLWRSFNP